MDKLLEFLIPILFVLFAIIQAVAAAKRKAKKKPVRKPAEKAERQESWTYQASGDDVREFLARLTGKEQEKPKQGGPSPTTPRARPQEMKADGLIPTARRDRRVAAPASAPATERPKTTRHLRIDPAGAAGTARASTTRHVADADAPPPSGGSFQKRQSTAPSAKQKRPAPAATKAPAPAAHVTIKRRRTGLSAKARRAQGATGAVTATDIAEQHPRKGVEIPPLGVKGLRQAIVLSEVLGPPLALRPPRALD